MRKFENPHEEVLHRTKKGFKKQVGWRRHLHRYPELSFQEFKTTAFLKKEVKKLGFKIARVPDSGEYEMSMDLDKFDGV